MAALQLDFVRKSTWRMSTIVLLMLGVAGSGFLLWQRDQLLERRATALARIDAYRHTVIKSHPEPLPPPRKEAIEEAERLVAGLQLPWEPMLNSLQSAVQDDILLQRVQPETDAFRLRISGQADNSQAFIGFVQRLQGDAFWRNVEPLSEVKQPEATASGGKPLAFQLAVQRRRP
ncbi:MULTISPECIES: PilN domain-containing protein [Ralstonia]|uniref:PilN domain-containing protein n=1 Tax=Ralstonia pickettii TaxID=329 RepID=A0AAW4QDW3_RALPI|nr:MULTISPECIES: PilN domain-containing protein [Ralstonia]MBA9848517.1 hypothetical protein [Ralstonia pickettii]MBA9853992.1 hypothetical protein [Ralstonia pickettii]MBA9921624.1 hypothetical protein [Ralstonia pickettii]MBA9960651.1 hypothetical protein [Ralstonia pickettii]MBA9966097.1 hypothetical protein [Ralstonia pickettii]